MGKDELKIMNVSRLTCPCITFWTSVKEIHPGETQSRYADPTHLLREGFRHVQLEENPETDPGHAEEIMSHMAWEHLCVLHEELWGSELLCWGCCPCNPKSDEQKLMDWWIISQYLLVSTCSCRIVMQHHGMTGRAVMQYHTNTSKSFGSFVCIRLNRLSLKYRCMSYLIFNMTSVTVKHTLPVLESTPAVFYRMKWSLVSITHY